jgi:3-oxoacyl-[acyl-carrier protein] reductase
MASSDDREAQIQARMPLRYVSEPAEQAAVILFLASEAASFVHGAIVDVDGGLL